MVNRVMLINWLIIKTWLRWVVSIWFWWLCSWQLRTGSRATVVKHLSCQPQASVGNGFIFCIAWFIIVRQTEKWREVHGGRWGVHASGFWGGDYDPGKVRCNGLCCARGIVTTPFRGTVVVLRHMVTWCGVVSCGYSGTPLARVKLFE